MGGRELDLSQGAAETIGLTQAGVDYAEYSRVGGAYDTSTERPLELTSRSAPSGSVLWAAVYP